MAQPSSYQHQPPPPSSDELVYDDGEPMESARHCEQMLMLIGSLRYSWRERSDFYVGGNMFLYFSEAQARHNDFRGPDVFVALNTTPRERKAWVIWEENGQAPNVIIELLSASTEHVDRGEKMQIYGRRLKVGEYFLFDPFSGVLEGYSLDIMHGDYIPKVPDAEGRLRCEQLGLLLGKARSVHYYINADWLRWMTPDGEVLALPSEVAESAVERADQEAQRAASAVERADQEAQRAESAVERADQEAQRAESAVERANQEAQRAESAVERADQLAKEVEALKAQLRNSK